MVYLINASVSLVVSLSIEFMDESNRIIVSIDVTELVDFINDLWWDKDYYEMSLAEKCRWLVEDNVWMTIDSKNVELPVDDRKIRSLTAEASTEEDRLQMQRYREGIEWFPQCPLPKISDTN